MKVGNPFLLEGRQPNCDYRPTSQFPFLADKRPGMAEDAGSHNETEMGCEIDIELTYLSHASQSPPES